MKVNVLLLNSIIISLISGCTFFPDVEVDDISHIESEIYNPAYTECMDDDMTKTQIFNNKNNFLVRETTDGFFLCGPIDDKLGIYYKDNNADIWKLCCEGTCILGPIFDNYLYFLSADFENNKILMERIDVESLKKEVLCTSSILSFDNIAIYSNLLIVYSGNDLSNGIVFEIDENNRVSQEYTIFESMISNEFTEGEYRISADYKQIYYVDNNDYHEVYRFNPFECSYQYINRVDNIELLTEEGIVFSHNKYLYLLDGLSGDIEKISKIEADFVLVNYSDNCYYVLLTKQNNVEELVCINSDGTSKHIYNFENVVFPARLCISVLDNKILYYDNTMQKIYSIDTENGIAKLVSNLYNIIYLDIQMGGLDGLAVGKYIRKMELDSIIVYISEYIEYIESVFEVEAFEFIRKPISNEKFMLTLKRALNRLDRKQYFFDCKYKNYWIRIPIKDIVYFESSGRKINIHLKDNKMEIFNGKLDNVEIKLSNSPSLFLRIHKSYLVNLSYIRAISGKKARLINELVLPISDDRKDNVRKQYVKCLGEDISERDN